MRRLLGPRLAIVGRAALENVRDEHLRTLEPDRLQHAVEELARPAHEGLTLCILVRARCLADHHPFRLSIADSEYRLRARLLQTAQRAAGNLSLQRLPVQERNLARSLTCLRLLAGAAWRARHIPVDAELLQV